MEYRTSHYTKDFMKQTQPKRFFFQLKGKKKLFSVEEKLLQDRESFCNAIQSQTTSTSLQLYPPKCFAELYEPKNKFNLVQSNLGIKTPEPEFRIKVSPLF